MSMTVDVPMPLTPADAPPADAVTAAATDPVVTPARRRFWTPILAYRRPGIFRFDRPERLLPILNDEPAGYRRTWVGVAAVVVALYATLIFGLFAPADGGVDQNAYLVGGRMIAEHLSPKYTLPNPYAYVGGMFVRVSPVGVKGGDYYPKYPFGLPLLFAGFFWLKTAMMALPLVNRLAWVKAMQPGVWAFVVSPASAVLAVAGLFLLARQVAGSFAGLLAAIVLATSHVMLVLADNPNSHAPTTAFVVWGFYLLVRWWQTDRLWRGVVGGFLIGYAATIRYSEALLVLPVAVVCLARLFYKDGRTWIELVTTVLFGGAILGYGTQWAAHSWFAHIPRLLPMATHTLGADLKRPFTIVGNVMAAGSWPRTIGTILASIAVVAGPIFLLRPVSWFAYLRRIAPGFAWAVPVAVLLWSNQVTLHTWTGYDATSESAVGSAFTWLKFRLTWEETLRTYTDLGLFFAVPLGVAGLAMSFRRSWQLGLMLTLWAIPGAVLYTSYYWSPDSDVAFGRFFLSLFPPVVVGVAICLQDGILSHARDGHKFLGRWSAIPPTVAAGLVVAVAAGVSSWRAYEGKRDGADGGVKTLNEDYRERANLASTGRHLLAADIPARSVLFVEGGGGITNAPNYVQFLRDWDVYSIDVFSDTGHRRGLPPGAGIGGRPGNGRRGVFAGIANAANGNNADPNAAAANPLATPIQAEQQLYHASLYVNEKQNDLTSTELNTLQVKVVDDALANGHKVFIAAYKTFTEDGEATGGGGFFGGGGGRGGMGRGNNGPGGGGPGGGGNGGGGNAFPNWGGGNNRRNGGGNNGNAGGNRTANAGRTAVAHTASAVEFEQRLARAGTYTYTVVAGWRDVAPIPDKRDQEDADSEDVKAAKRWMGHGFGGGGNRGGGGMFNQPAALADWQLIEVTRKG